MAAHLILAIHSPPFPLGPKRRQTKIDRDPELSALLTLSTKIRFLLQGRERR
jgi:hypothetical protein